ncbi:UNVERIFIED_CONTAM: hypothetical protein Sradi_3992000 [Sesamum radiatum]|uniref:Uncharacterized protein n=1 Tax=Sesamum radiatum TaxID=300843 RepID=A0AAW2PLN3_SESRA
MAWAICASCSFIAVASVIMVGKIKKGVDFEFISVGLAEFEQFEGVVSTILPRWRIDLQC